MCFTSRGQSIPQGTLRLTGEHGLLELVVFPWITAEVFLHPLVIFVFRHPIQLLSPVCSIEYLKTSLEICLPSDMYLTGMYRKGSVPSRT